MKVNIWKFVFLCVQYRKPYYFNLLTTHNLLPTDPLRNRTSKLYQVTYIKRVTFSAGFVHNMNEARTEVTTFAFSFYIMHITYYAFPRIIGHRGLMVYWFRT